MLIFALEYCEAIDKILVNREMRKYELSEEEWKLVQQLYNVLAVCCAAHRPIPVTHVFSDFKDTTFFFSHSTLNLATVIPTMDHIYTHLATVIPTMDHIYTHLATASQDLKYLPAIHASLVLGKAHLNKYYNMTDHSEVY